MNNTWINRRSVLMGSLLLGAGVFGHLDQPGDPRQAALQHGKRPDAHHPGGRGRHFAGGQSRRADMVAYAKAHPGKLAYGTWGNGSSGHLTMEGIKAHYGLDMPHVPYKALSTEVSDLLGNNISVAFTDIASPIPHMRSGKLVALGTTGSQRWPATQDVASLTEQGYKFDADGWYGVFAPASTPRKIIETLNEELNRVQKMPEVRQKIEGQNMSVPVGRSARQFAESIKADAVIWQGLAKTTNLKDK